MLDINSMTPLQPPKSPLDAFDPNNRDKGAPPWATYCPSRTPTFRVHKMRSHAIGAMHNHGRYSGAVLFAYEGGKWVEAARFELSAFLPSRCERCNTNLMTKPEQVYDYPNHKYVATGRMLNDGEQVFEKRKGRVTTPPRVLTLCGGCARDNR